MPPAHVTWRRIGEHPAPPAPQALETPTLPHSSHLPRPLQKRTRHRIHHHDSTPPTQAGSTAARQLEMVPPPTHHHILTTPRLTLCPPLQPPKRRPAAATTDAGPSRAARPSKLAKEHGITAQEETDIREAFSLFSEPMAGEKEGVIPIPDVRRALMYFPPTPHLHPH